jgi:hypothetical protein
VPRESASQAAPARGRQRVPSKRPRAKDDGEKPRPPSETRRPDPAALALTLTALRRFADAPKKRNAVDRAVARSLKRMP